MKPAPSIPRVALCSCLLVVAATGCAALSKVLSQPPTMEARAWQLEEVLVEPGTATLGTPAVFVDAQGRPLVAMADEAFYVATKALALARRTDAGWRVELPTTPAPHRVCGRAQGPQVVLTLRELEGEPTALRWSGADGVAEAGAEPDACERLDPNLRELSGRVPHRLELSKDGRTLWHELPEGGTACPPHDSTPGMTIDAFAVALDDGGRPHAVLYEHGEGEGPGQLRHAVCRDAKWTSSLIAADVVVTEVGLALAGARPHVAYVVQGPTEVRLMHATPREGAPPPAAVRDARVLPALEACERQWRQPPPSQARGIEAYQSGDGLRCAVLERDAVTGQQALAELEPRCEGGDALACALAGSLHHRLMGEVSVSLELPAGPSARFHIQWQGLRAAGVPEDLDRAREAFGRGCEGGDARACLYHAVLLPSEDPRRRTQARGACEAGLAAGCALELALVALRPDDGLAKRAAKVLRPACEGRDLTACNDLGVLQQVQGRAAKARASIDRACQGGDEVACRNLGQLPAG